ncbi:MAG TPA: zinc ribbon domain-containing protein [Fimbriimonas sp.]
MPRCYRDRQASPQPDHRFCVYCGHPLVMPCPYCSADVPLLTEDQSTRRCPTCRHPLKFCPSPDCGRLLPLEAQSCPAGHPDALIEPFGEWVAEGGDSGRRFRYLLPRPLKPGPWQVQPSGAAETGAEIVSIVDSGGFTVAATRAVATVLVDGEFAGSRPMPSVLPSEPWRVLAHHGVLYAALADRLVAFDLAGGGQRELAGRFVAQTPFGDFWLGLKSSGAALVPVLWKQGASETELGGISLPESELSALVASKSKAYVVGRTGAVWEIDGETTRPIDAAGALEVHHAGVSVAGLMLFGRLEGETVVRIHPAGGTARTVVLEDLHGFATPPMIGERSFWIVGVGEPPTIRQYAIASATETQRATYGYASFETCIALEGENSVSFLATVRDPQRKVVVLSFPQSAVVATLFHASPAKVPSISISEGSVAIGNSQSGDNKVRVFSLPLE